MATVFFSLNGNSAASPSSFLRRASEWRDLLEKTSYICLKGRQRTVNVRNWALGQRGFAMMRLLRLLLILAVLVGAAVVGYAYLGDLSPEQNEVSEPVTLDGN